MNVVLCAALLLLVPSPAASSFEPKRPIAKCERACYNGGTCRNGTCACPPGWSGTFCDSCYGRQKLDVAGGGVFTHGVGNYSHSLRCSWLVDGKELNARRVRLDFISFETECNWDHLFVFAGDGVYATQVGAFSGILTPQHRPKRELVIDGPRAYLYFYTDAAFNMSGFNISYTFDECARNCNDRGTCNTTTFTCNCAPGWTGPTCEQPIAAAGESDSSAARQSETLTVERHWQALTAGDIRFDASSLTQDDLRLVLSRASHTSVVVADEMLVLGGDYFNFAPPISGEFDARQMLLARYRFLTNQWELARPPTGVLWPANRYDHVTVFHDKQLYVFGGVIGRQNVTAELWTLQLASTQWVLVSGDAATSGKESRRQPPFACSGHSAHVIDGAGPAARMIVVFGYNANTGMLNAIQEFTFASNSWRVLPTNGAQPRGSFGHVSVYDDASSTLFVYGGFVTSTGTAGSAVDTLYALNVVTLDWQALMASGFVHYLHSAALVSGTMIVVGGNGHNESAPAKQPTQCYAPVVLAFDVECRLWHALSYPDYLLSAGASRYGHSAVVYNGSMYVFGGFDSQMLADVLVFTPGDCRRHRTSQECWGASFRTDGVKCVWLSAPAGTTAAASRCVSFAEAVATGVNFEKGCSVSSTAVGRKPACADFDDCFSCMNNARPCVWCDEIGKCAEGPSCFGPPMLNGGSGARQADALGDEPQKKSSRTPIQSSKNCTSSRNVCERQTTCAACVAHSDCRWGGDERSPATAILPPHAAAALAAAANAHAALPKLAAPSCYAPVPSGSGSGGDEDAFLSSNFGDGGSSAAAPAAGGKYKSASGGASSSGSGAPPGEGGVSSSFPHAFFKGAQSALAAAQRNRTCVGPCGSLRDCQQCMDGHQCLWCPNVRRCIEINAYLLAFAYGQCVHWLTRDQRRMNVCAADALASEETECAAQLTCADCQAAGPSCGWCDDESRTGLGRCIHGTFSGPLPVPGSNSTAQCKPSDWWFVNCPSCQCNGHGQCANATGESANELATSGAGGRPSTGLLPCLSCSGLTVGDRCETCQPGYYGNALNGGNCTACECNKQANMCHQQTGKCFCFTKGVVGEHCDRCDPSGGKYVGDPRNETCFYDLAVDFVFTFNLLNEDEANLTRINFVNRPTKENTDVLFKLSCSGTAIVNLTIASSAPGVSRPLLRNTPCGTIERRFDADEFKIGGNEFNTTFYVYVIDFRTPITIQISFAQTPAIDWIKFFITFASCFLSLLVVAALLWKVKQRWDVYRRRQRMFVEMEQMASRPFGCVNLELPTSAMALLPRVGRVHAAPLKQPASAISVEPCSNYRAAIVSVIVRLPTGGAKYVPNGQSGLAIASALVHVAPQHLAVLEHPPSPETVEQTSKRRRTAQLAAFLTNWRR